MEEVNKSIKFINEKFGEIEECKKEKERHILELKKEVKTLNEQVEIMDRVWIVMNKVLEGTVFLSMM